MTCYSFIIAVLLVAYKAACWPQQRKCNRLPISYLLAYASHDILYDSKDIDQLIQNFWKTHPCRLAERIVKSCLIKGNTCSKLVVPLVQLPEKYDGNDNDYFSTFYTGNLLHSLETIGESFRIDNREINYKKKLSFCLVFAYDGQHFCGWQRQPHNSFFPSVQEVIEDSIEAAFPENGRPDVRVSGRTDSGVHAIGQIARVRIMAQRILNDDTTIVSATDVFDALNIAAKASSYTWRCLSVQAVSDKFHPTFNAKSRSYIYALDASMVFELIMSVKAPDVTVDAEASHSHLLLETIALLNLLLKDLVGQQLDYYSFSYGKVKTKSTVCCLNHAFVRLGKVVQSHTNEMILIFEFTSDRFLRRMIRLLVGTALSLTIQSLAISSSNAFTNTTNVNPTLIDICNLKDRTQHLKTAPPGGLIFIGANVTI
jgi:tRNA pseudouridine(38-40) synthase